MAIHAKSTNTQSNDCEDRWQVSRSNSSQAIPLERRNFRISEFGKVYGLGRTKTYMEIKAGRLRAFKVGRITLISREAAESWQALRERAQ